MSVHFNIKNGQVHLHLQVFPTSIQLCALIGNGQAGSSISPIPVVPDLVYPIGCVSVQRPVSRSHNFKEGFSQISSRGIS